MKNLKQILLAILLCSTFGALAQNTTIWVVRHAEKDTARNNPELTQTGKARANQLAKELKGQKISAVFATPYKRTQQTAEPTVKEFSLEQIQAYNPSDLAKFAKQLLSDYAGKNILVVGHSNTLIPTVKALGAQTPVDSLTDDDYDFLFKVTVDPNGKATVEVKHYGAKHHTTIIPSN